MCKASALLFYFPHFLSVFALLALLSLRLPSCLQSPSASGEIFMGHVKNVHRLITVMMMMKRENAETLERLNDCQTVKRRIRSIIDTKAIE